ncbi:hypothetical protein [Streptomyces coeruleorubidus]
MKDNTKPKRELSTEERWVKAALPLVLVLSLSILIHGVLSLFIALAIAKP